MNRNTLVLLLPAASCAGQQAKRFRMVEGQIAARGATDPLVLSAMRKVKRHLFVPEARGRWSSSSSPGGGS